MKIFLTGGSGMVGHAILANAGSTAHEFIAPSSRDLDLRNRSAVLAAFERFEPDAVIHAAGRVGGIAANIAAPADFLIANMDMGLNVVEAARQVEIPRILNLGSSCMYPHDAASPLCEDILGTGQLEPTNEGYALAKLAVARAGVFANQQDKETRFKTIIPCNLYGPHDKFDPLKSHLIPAVVRKVHEAQTQNLPSVEIWGDGSARREFMYVGDLAAFILDALERFDALPDVLNVGPGFDHSVKEYYEAVAAAVDWDGHFTFDLNRPVGMRQKLLDISAQTRFGWAPETTLRDGILLTYRYFLDHVRE